ncbi:hypothetical protein EDD85DRAFT_793222 [Armillaria nabsnona]|nr:hypothetical protein EDD85DRAFT_793222 [Armillaria nabsnona]
MTSNTGTLFCSTLLTLDGHQTLESTHFAVTLVSQLVKERIEGYSNSAKEDKRQTKKMAGKRAGLVCDAISITDIPSRFTQKAFSIQKLPSLIDVLRRFLGTWTTRQREEWMGWEVGGGPASGKTLVHAVIVQARDFHTVIVLKLAIRPYKAGD